MMTIDQAIRAVKTQVSFEGEITLEYLRRNFKDQYPVCLKALKTLDVEHTMPKLRKGYNLVRRESKKRGFVYYARFSDCGRMLPTMRCTHTNNLEEAQAFARENKERIVAEYKAKHEGKSLFFETLEKYFEKGSEYLVDDSLHNRSVGDKQRQIYHNVMNNRFIPFLKESGVYCARGITAELITEFQKKIHFSGLKPQTVNKYLSGINRICGYFRACGTLKENPLRDVEPLVVRKKDRRARGCHEISRVNGVFNEVWEDRLLHLLVLIIYTTNMRNSEIERIRLCDITEIEGCRFVKVEQSKTDSGERLVPLHPLVYKKIIEYSREAGRSAEEYIIPRMGKSLQSTTYRKSNIELGKRLGMGVEELKKENITFYSGRHYWKTLMNSEGLGADIEEVFMGHKVSSDVAKRYNHRDKIGKARMLAAARNVYKILDENLFEGMSAAG
jgi:integrase